jgi:hypothetical protein
LQLLTKFPNKKTHAFNVSKLSRIIENNFNISFPQKQPCYNTILEIDKTWMKE